MKNGTFLLFIFLVSASGFSQNAKYQLPVRQTPTFKKEQLIDAKSVNDLSPLLWNSLSFPYSERYYLNQRRIQNYAQPQAADYIYPQDGYKKILDVVFVEISVTSNGKAVTAQSKSDILTPQQKDILNTADLGSAINVKIKFKYKDQSTDSYAPRNKVIEGSTQVIVVPEQEAEFPGGYKQLSDYFIGNVINKTSEDSASEKIQQAIVKFTVNEQGQVADAKISRTSTYTNIDKLLLDALNKMPKWKPAVNSKGVKVKQEVIIPFGVGC